MILNCIYKKHNNYCSKLYKKEGSHTSKINLVNNEEVISDEIASAETFSKFYENAVENLGISEEIHT